MKKRATAIPCVYLFWRRGNNILLTRRCNTGYQDGNYSVPSGHIEEGELPIDAIQREVSEEIDVRLYPFDLTLVHVSYRPKHDDTGSRVDFFFETFKESWEIRNLEPKKCDSIIWVPLDALPDNMAPITRLAIGLVQEKRSFSSIPPELLRTLGLWKL